MRELLKFAAVVTVILGVVVGVLLGFFITVVEIEDDSMAPTLLAGEKALLWRDAEPEIGDIVICAHPGEPGTMVMGRVTATSGMSVAVARSQLLVNNQRLDRDWQGRFHFDDPDAPEPIQVSYGIESLPGVDHEFMQVERFELNLTNTTVGGGRLYLLSDYRSKLGFDSRTYGPVVANTCIGQLFMRLSPVPDFSGPDPIDHGHLDILDDQN